LLRRSDYPLSPDVYAALSDAELVLFEVAPGDMDASAAEVMGLAARRSDGRTLDQEIGPELAARLRKWVAALPAEIPLQGYDPWYAAMTVAMWQMMEMGLDPRLGMDVHVMSRAAEFGKETGGLETVLQQVAVFDAMDSEEQVQMLADALDSASDGEAEVEQLHADWRAGRADALWEGMGADLRREYPQLYRAINVARNQAWLPRIAARLEAPDGDDTLVVVGALHLLGEDGVVEGLRDLGYAVERICSACAASGD